MEDNLCQNYIMLVLDKMRNIGNYSLLDRCGYACCKMILFFLVDFLHLKAYVTLKNYILAQIPFHSKHVRSYTDNRLFLLCGYSNTLSIVFWPDLTRDIYSLLCFWGSKQAIKQNLEEQKLYPHVDICPCWYTHGIQLSFGFTWLDSFRRNYGTSLSNYPSNTYENS